MNFLSHMLMFPFEKAKFRYLKKTYSSALYHKAFSILKEDALAEEAVFCTLSRITPHLRLFFRKSPDETKVLLSLVIKYAVLSELHTQKEKEAAFLSDNNPDLADWNLSSNESLPKQLSPFVESLPPVKQDLLLLFYVYQINPETAADLLNLPLDTARTYFSEAIEYLSEVFKGTDT